MDGDIATYNWAFMSPTCEGNRLSMLSGGPNGYATPGLAMTWGLSGRHSYLPAGERHDQGRLARGDAAHMGEWVQVDSSAAGIAFGQAWSRWRDVQPRRAIVAVPAANGRAYDVGAFPSAGTGFEDRDGVTPSGGINRGTNPHLTSAKYTGYGIVLRAAVDTPDEISVYLQQIDKGPNYRWGYANQNGSGDIYYYANGRSYSGHEREDAGDGHVDDAMFSCNTGVYKNWHFQCIGMNELTEPFYNLDCAQFAELLPDSGPAPYSWPEYQGRSVLLAGADYILVLDRILDPCGTRFAWNISPADEMPYLYHIKGGGDPVNLAVARSGFVRGSFSTMIKGGGSHLALVTHRDDVKIVADRRKKGEPPAPFVHVRTRDAEDYLFDDGQPVAYSANGLRFEGSAGLIRRRKDGTRELTLFHGSAIGDHEVTISVDNPNLGISAVTGAAGSIHGRFFSREGGKLSLDAPSKGGFFVDGVAVAAGPDGRYQLPAGDRRWELTDGIPEPMPPVMLRTENRGGGAKVLFSISPGAEKYRIEISRDSGATWERAGETTTGEYDLTSLSNGTKIHVRAIALNGARESRPANEYPVYVTDQSPLPPDGLKLSLAYGDVQISWGEVLGITEYRLYRRKKGEKKFIEVFRGKGNEFTDHADGVVPAFAEPGAEANATRDLSGAPIYEYAVAAVNGNGEGVKSGIADTDPRSWRNWTPEPAGERFKRQSSFWLPPYVLPQDSPPEYYPGE